MSLTRYTTPEVFFTDTASKVDTYSALSRRFAADGDAHAAVHALWAADIATVQMIAWERIMIASPNPDRQFFAVAKTVVDALSAYAVSTVSEPLTAYDVVQAARAGLEQAFDDSFLHLLRDRYVPVDHLMTLRAPTPQDAVTAVQSRLEGMSVNDFVAHRLQVADHAIGQAREQAAAGNTDTAIAQAYQADLAAFEAYLVEAARVVGDNFLITVDLRWALASEAISRIPALPADVASASATIRDVLASTVGPVEADRLRQRFAAVA